MDPRDVVTLTTSGGAHEGWTSVVVTRGLEGMAGQFELELTEKWEDRQRRDIFTGDRFTLSIGGDLVMTGWLDAVRPTFDAGNHVVRASGRSLTSDLVDCSIVSRPMQWRGKRVEEIAAVLAAPFGVSVLTAGAETDGAYGLIAADTGKPIPAVTAQEGDKAFDLIEKVAKMRGVTAVTDAGGRLLFIKPLERSLPTLIARGFNVLSAGSERDDTDRFSHYMAKGQTSGGRLGTEAETPWMRGGGFIPFLPGNPASAVGLSGPAQYAHLSGELVDPTVKRYRPLVITSSDAQNGLTLQDQLRNEMHRRIGKSERAEIVVKGWRCTTDDGEAPVWPFGRRVRIEDPEWLKLNREMVIAETKLTMSESDGTRTTLVLVPTEAYDIRPPREASTGSTGTSGRSADVENPWTPGGGFAKDAR